MLGLIEQAAGKGYGLTNRGGWEVSRTPRSGGEAGKPSAFPKDMGHRSTADEGCFTLGLSLPQGTGKPSVPWGEVCG